MNNHFYITLHIPVTAQSDAAVRGVAQRLSRMVDMELLNEPRGSWWDVSVDEDSAEAV